MGCSSSMEFEKTVSLHGSKAPQQSSREERRADKRNVSALAQRSVMQRQTAASVAEGMLERTSGQRFHDNYVSVPSHARLHVPRVEWEGGCMRWEAEGHVPDSMHAGQCRCEQP